MDVDPDVSIDFFWCLCYPSRWLEPSGTGALASRREIARRFGCAPSVVFCDLYFSRVRPAVEFLVGLGFLVYFFGAESLELTPKNGPQTPKLHRWMRHAPALVPRAHPLRTCSDQLGIDGIPGAGWMGGG